MPSRFLNFNADAADRWVFAVTVILLPLALLI